MYETTVSWSQITQWAVPGWSTSRECDPTSANVPCNVRLRSGSARYRANCLSYVDAVQVLYSSNIFDFDSMESFICLSCAVLPAKFDSIQSIQLDFRFSDSHHFSESQPRNDWPRWERTWRIIDSMKALQRIRVRITWPRAEPSGKEEANLLQPLLQIRHMKTYEVSLPPLTGNEIEWSVDVPFRIFRLTS
jgi:hypothetical protein